MRIILISATGLSAGKTTLARKFTDVVISLADEIRRELSEEYPHVNFYGKTQEQKNVRVLQTSKTVREMLIERGQARRAENEDHWVNLAISRVKEIVDHHLNATIAVDDLRFLNELHRFQAVFGSSIVHMHIDEASAIEELQYQNKELAAVADYVIRRG